MSTIPNYERSKTIRLIAIFEVSLYALVGLASVMLAFSEGFEHGPPPQSFTVPLLIISGLIVDRWRLWFLPWWVAGTLGIIALIGAFWNIPQYVQFYNGIPVFPEERRLDLIFAGAHLLVFLTWIVLFLPKTNQQYWWLWALAVLQISVGASQSTESIFGVLLCVYLLLAVWTLSVFSLLQGQQQFDRAQQIAEATNGLAPEPVEKESRRAPDRRILGLDFWRQPSSAIGNVQRDPAESWINLRFVGGVAGTASLAFLTAMLFFFLIPRHSAIWKRGQVESESESGTSTTGFSRNISLGEIGQILESTKKVMEVELTDQNTGEVLDIEKYAFEMGFGEPLFRGMTANRYSAGSWSATLDGNRQGNPVQILPSLRFPRGDLVRQHIRLDPVDAELLFAMPPALYGGITGSSRPICIEQPNDILKPVDAVSSHETIDYVVISPKSSASKGSIPLRPFQARFLKLQSQNYLDVPRRDLAELVRVARERSGYLESPAPSPREMAQRLESYLKDSGEFTYTLNANVSDPGIDPLEDFVVNRKMGHCEYFASALTLMLRTVDIPARMVSGFKGGEYDEKTGWFIVQERHAHAWVEAFIDNQWLVLDPTPAGRDEVVKSVANSPNRWNQFRAMMKDSWSRFVINLNGNEQQRLLMPIKQFLTEAAAWLRNGGSHFSELVNNLKQQLRSPERWISWQGGLVTFTLLSLLAGLWVAGRWLWNLITKLKSQFLAQERLAKTVAFYERFREICNGFGLSREASETPKEFALDVTAYFRDVLSGSGCEQFPLALTDAYYEVRYGSRQLAPETLGQLEQQLAEFARILGQTEPNSAQPVS